MLPICKWRNIGNDLQTGLENLKIILKNSSSYHKESRNSIQIAVFSYDNILLSISK
jgi:hypothetical protein